MPNGKGMWRARAAFIRKTWSAIREPTSVMRRRRGSGGSHPAPGTPSRAWKALSPLPYEAALRRQSAKNGLDPMFVAGLIRQESTFQPDALSHAGAVGLMQVLPITARKVSKQLRIRYSRNKLIDPEYNLTVGTAYLRGLIQDFGGPEQ